MSYLNNAYALLIGVGNDLPVTVRDATAINNILADETLAGYNPKNVKLVTEKKATRKGILDAFDWLISKTDEDSSVLLFYSGHGGLYEPWNQFYLVPNNFDPDEYETTWVKAEELKEKINALVSKRLIFFLDCCHAAGMLKSGVTVGQNISSNDKENNGTKATPNKPEKAEGLAQKIDDDKGMSIVSSCREDQLSYIMEGDSNSLFTKCLIEVLKGKHKTHFDEEYVRISEVVQYIFRKIPERNENQKPYVNLQIYDDFVLSYIPQNLRANVPEPMVEVSNTTKAEQKEVVTAFRESDGATNLLLFIHGFSGEAADTFGIIPELLAQDSKMDGWDMKPLGYSQNVKPEFGKEIWAGIDDIDKISDYLSTSIKYKFDKYDRVAIVAHSLGGLVAQRAILDLKEEFRNKISHLILLGTPSNGIAADILSDSWNNKYKAMSSDGEFIKDLRKGWKDTFKNEYTFTLKAAASTDDEYVTSASCFDPFNEDQCEVIDGNHLSMVKPMDVNDDCYNLILDTLTGNEFYNKFTNSEEINLTLGKYDVVVKQLLPKIDSLDPNGLKQLIFSLEGLDKKEEVLKILNEHPLAKDNTDLMGLLAGRHKRAYLQSFSKNDGDAALEYYGKALDIAVAEENNNQIYYHAINLAFLSIVINGNETKMIKYAKQALETANNSRNNLWKYATVAEANMYLDNMGEAKEFYTKASKMADIRQKISMYTNAYAGYTSLMQMDNPDDDFIKFLKAKFLS